MSDLEILSRGGAVSDPRKDPTLTDAEIQTRRVDDAKVAWETPRLTELGVSGSGAGAVSSAEDDTGPGADDAAGTS
jgi:hypothetical protein